MFFSRNKPYIRVKILSARDLVPHDSDGYVDPCVTVEVGGDTESTSTMSECLAPVWNEGFNFRINPDRPPLEVVLRCNDDRLLRRNRLLGMVRIPLHDFFDGNTPRLYRSGGQFTEQSIPMVDPRTKGYAGSLTVKYGWCFSIEDYYRPEFQENWMRMMQNLEQMRFRDHPSSFDNYYGESFHHNGRFPRSNSTHHHGPHPSYGYPQDHWRSGHGQFSHSRAQGSYPEGSPEPPHPMRSSSFHRPGEESGHYRGGTGSHSPGPSFAPGHEQSHYDFGGGASQYPGSSGFGMGNAAGGGGYNSEFGSRMGHGSMPYGAPPPPPFMGPGGIPPMNGGMGGGPPNGFGAVPSFQGGMRSSYPPPPPPPFPNMPGMRPMMPPQNHEFPPFAAPGYAAPPHFM